MTPAANLVALVLVIGITEIHVANLACRNIPTATADLPIGKYDVSEQTNWSWRYTPKSGLQTITLVPSGGTLTFENSRTQTQWLDGDNYRVNHFDSKNQ